MNQIAKRNETARRAAREAPEGNLSALTGLRFLAAFSVVIAHGSILLLRFDPQIDVIRWLSTSAGFGMTLFFVLSGFVIHYNYRRIATERTLDSLGGFLWARFARLYPLFLLMLVFDVLVGSKLFQRMQGNEFSFDDVLRSLPYYLLFIQSWVYAPIGDNSLIYVTGTNIALTWSISTEWFFYLAYPVVAWCLLWIRRPAVTIAAIVIWSLIWITFASTLAGHAHQIDTWAIGHYGQIAGIKNGYQDSFYRWLVYFSPYVRIGEFILGCLVAQLYILVGQRPISDREHAIGKYALAAATISVPVILYLTHSTVNQVQMVAPLGSNFGLAPSCAAIIFCASRYDNAISRFFRHRSLVSLGEASYSTYLIHFLIFSSISTVLGHSLPPTAPSVAFLLLRFAFVVMVVLLVSLGLHAYLEVPARNWLRALWGKRNSGAHRTAALSLLASPAIAAIAAFMLANSLDATATVSSGIRLVSATYGLNCGAKLGNVTRLLEAACNGKDSCKYKIDPSKLGDPAGGCAKSFVAEYQCMPNGAPSSEEIPGEASLSSGLSLSCLHDASKAGPVKPNLAATVPSAFAAPVVQAASEAADPDSGIDIKSATYGLNCGAETGNASRHLKDACNGKDTCDYVVDVQNFGDPKQGCAKNFIAHYECAPGHRRLVATIHEEAGLGKHLLLNCAAPASGARVLSPGIMVEPPTTGIYVRSATYGPNCGAMPGNASDDLGNACDGKDSCDYKIDVANFGDPRRGCAKSFTVQYQCAPGSVRFMKTLSGETGLGRHLLLNCTAPMMEAASSRPIALITPPTEGIFIKAATYGLNCGAKSGNATVDLSNSCNGKYQCDYQVDVANFGDPKQGCEKDFMALYQCFPGSAVVTRKLPAEAGLGSLLRLNCSDKASQ